MKKQLVSYTILEEMLTRGAARDAVVWASYAHGLEAAAECVRVAMTPRIEDSNPVAFALLTVLEDRLSNAVALALIEVNKRS